MENKRARRLNEKEIGDGPIIYWMSRDQRARDNWALLAAQKLAKERGQPYAVVFCLTTPFLHATLRQYSFMLKGLSETAEALGTKHIPFYLLEGNVVDELKTFAKRFEPGAIICDFSPLKISRKWKNKLAKSLPCAMFEVDAHNVVPAWVASDKMEYAAYTFRPKIKKLQRNYLEEFSSLQLQPLLWPGKIPSIDWERILGKLDIDRDVGPVTWAKPGNAAAKRKLEEFFKKRLRDYRQNLRDPAEDGQSGLSPYIHFGQISVARILLSMRKLHGNTGSKTIFKEELVVRRELAENFCLYNEDYDSPKGFPDWAKMSLKAHARDKRKYTYTKGKFEKAQTHDDLWNAAQKEMLINGKMHGYMRMYWAKKIAEWSKSPEDAMKIAIYLNDKYELDGRDPSGYAGIAWSIGGVHDRAWMDRPVTGKVRSMTYNGCRNKFNVSAYISLIEKLEEK